MPDCQMNHESRAGWVCLMAFVLLAGCSSRAAPARHAHAPGAQSPHVHEPGEAHSHGYQHDFSEVERYARRFDDPKRDAWQRPEKVVEALRLEPGDTVVDLGAGTGYFVPHLSRAVGPSGTVLALDVEPKMVDYLEQRAQAEQLHNVISRRVAADDPGLAPESVQRVLIVNTWHHLGDRESYAKKLAQALAPGGQVWVVDFTLDAELGPPRKHRLPAAQVVAELQAAGLRAELAPSEDLPKQYVVRGARP